MQLWAYCFCLVLALFSPVEGQATTGDIYGVATLEDGSSVSGVRVEISGDGLETREIVTNENGDFRFPGLPPGSYTVTMKFEGFGTQQRSVDLGMGEEARIKAVLLTAIEDDVAAGGPPFAIRTVHNAGGNYPSSLGSSVPRGSIAVGFVDGVDFGPLNQAAQTPLETELNGFSAYVMANGERFDTYPAFTVGGQFATIIGSETPVGAHFFVVDWRGMQDSFPIEITDVGLEFFSLDSTGQGTIVMTDADFYIITPSFPLAPGQTFIAWGTGGGPGMDRQGGVLNKIPDYDSIQVFIGGVPVENLIYSGSAGDFGGGDQLIGIAPENIPFSCGTSFEVKIVKNGVTSYSNPLTVPTGPDPESPCGDAHQLAEPLVDRLFVDKLRIFQFFMTELTFVPGVGLESADLIEGALVAEEIEEFTYEPWEGSGMCTYFWRPGGFPGFTRQLALDGTFQAILPDFGIPLDANGFFDPFNDLFGDLPDDRFVEGPYQIDVNNLLVENESIGQSWTGDYARQAGDLQNAVKDALIQLYDEQDGFFSPVQAFDLVKGAAPEGSSLAVQYSLNIFNGPAGNHSMSCTCLLNDETDVETMHTVLEQQSQTIMRSRMPDFFETGEIHVVLTPTNRNTRFLSGGPVDVTQEIFDTNAVFNLNPEALNKAMQDAPD